MTEESFYRTFESRAELYGTIKHLMHQYDNRYYKINVMSRYGKGRIQKRTASHEDLEYDREQNKLDIYGTPATGRFPNPDNVVGIKVVEKE